MNNFVLWGRGKWLGSEIDMLYFALKYDYYLSLSIAIIFAFLLLGWNT